MTLSFEYPAALEGMDEETLGKLRKIYDRMDRRIQKCLAEAEILGK